MPSTSIIPNSIDRNASSANRQRRNWQRLSQGAATGTIKTSAPITGGSTVGLSFLTTSGLGLTGSALAILFADASIVGSANGIKVQLASSSALSTTGTGLKVLIDGSTITFNSTGQLQASTSGGGSGIAGSTQLATTAPLAGGGVISTGLTLSIPAAGSTANGYLTSTDWITFNSKDAPLIAVDTSILIGSSTGSTTARVQLQTPTVLANQDFTTVAQNTSPYAIGGNGSTWYVATTTTAFFGVNTTVTSTALIVANASAPRIVQKDSGNAGIGAAIYVPTVSLPGNYSVSITGIVDQASATGSQASLAVIARANKSTFSATEGVSARVWTDSVQLIRHDTGASLGAYTISPVLSPSSTITLELRVSSTNILSVLLNGTTVLAAVTFTANSANTGVGFAVGGVISSTDGFGGNAGVQSWKLIDNTIPASGLSTGATGVGILLPQASGLIVSPVGLAVNTSADGSVVVTSTGIRVPLAALGGLTVNNGLSSNNGLLVRLADTTLTVGALGLAVGTLTSTNLPSTVGVTHIAGGGTAPTIAVGSAIPLGAATIVGHDTAGLITASTGTSGLAASAVICTVTFNKAYTAAPYVVFSPFASTGFNTVPLTLTFSSTTTTTFALVVGSTALLANKVYQWTYHVIG